MDFKKQFDMPLPVINKEVNKIYIETPNSCDGSLVIKNDGGGVMAGRIMSNSSSITFDPESFDGNNAKIAFYINLDFYNPGDVLKTNAVIMSNGGEHLIDFIIKVVPFAIETRENFRVTSLKDFYTYARKYPISARQLFVSHEFMMWLYSSGYDSMDLYEKFTKDANKERALDNFFILNKLKHKTKIACQNKSVCIKLYPYISEIYTGSLLITKNSWGYVDENISVMGRRPWLKIDRAKLVTSDFDESNNAYLNYFIDPKLLPKNINIEKILIGEDTITITAIKLNYIYADLECEFLSYNDDSHLIIQNNSGTRLTVDVLPQDNFVKFESERYYINDNAKIPFTVELSTLHAAQVSILKQPIIETTILLESIYNKKPFMKKLMLTVGNF